MRTIRLIAWLTGILVVFLGAAAFALSFDNLQALALSQGIAPDLTWLWPLGLDAMMIASALSILRGSLSSERTIFAWVLLFAFTIASVAFNVITFTNVLEGCVHGTPAVVLFLAVELLTGQVRTAIRRTSSVQSLDAIERAIVRQRAELRELEAKADAVERSTVQPTPERSTVRPNATHRTSSPNADKSRTMDVLLEYLVSNPNASFGQAANAVGRSKSTTHSMTGELVAAGKLRKNGSGWERV